MCVSEAVGKAWASLSLLKQSLLRSEYRAGVAGKALSPLSYLSGSTQSSRLCSCILFEESWDEYQQTDLRALCSAACEQLFIFILEDKEKGKRICI